MAPFSADTLDFTPFLKAVNEKKSTAAEDLCENLRRTRFYLPLYSLKSMKNRPKFIVSNAKKVPAHFLIDGHGNKLAILFSDHELLEKAATHYGWETDGDPIRYATLPGLFAFAYGHNLIKAGHRDALYINPLAASGVRFTAEELYQVASGKLKSLSNQPVDFSNAMPKTAPEGYSLGSHKPPLAQTMILDKISDWLGTFKVPQQQSSGQPKPLEGGVANPADFNQLANIIISEAMQSIPKEVESFSISISRQGPGEPFTVDSTLSGPSKTNFETKILAHLIDSFMHVDFLEYTINFDHNEVMQSETLPVKAPSDLTELHNLTLEPQEAIEGPSGAVVSKQKRERRKKEAKELFDFIPLEPEEVDGDV